MRELRVDGEAPAGALLDLELEDLTGLVRAASGGRALPPQESARDAAPLGIAREQHDEGLRIATVQRLHRSTQAIDHGSHYAAAALELVERVAANVGVEPEIRLVEVPTPTAATQMRFLGSPTIRVNGRDVEPGADDRDEFVLACRVYRSDSGFSGQPAEEWVRAALTEAR